MNVATALNRKYLLYTGVMLTSLCENNPCHIDVYILHSELTDKDIQRLKDCLDKYDVTIYLLYIEKDKFAGRMYTDKMWSIEAYYRLMLLDVLPPNVKRMFYFDVDIIVNKSLEAFYNMNFDGNDLIACEDDCGNCVPEHYGPMHRKIFGSEELHNHRYFNSGVLLMNIEQMRHKYNYDYYMGIARDVWNYKMEAPDQDTLDIFTYELKKEFEKIGLEVMIFNSQDMEGSMIKLSEFIKEPVKAVVTFNNLGFNMELIKGQNIWEQLQIPCINILMDHPFIHKKALDNAPANAVVICPDRNHMKFVQRFYPQIPIVGFLPHGGKAKDISIKPICERSIDILYAGGISYKFIEQSKPDFKEFTFDAKKIANETYEELINNPDRTTEDVIEERLLHNGIILSDNELLNVIEKLHYIDMMAVSYYREKTVKTLVDAGFKVTLYGTGWEVCDWIDNENLDYRGRVSADEIVDLMYDSKIVLNTMTWFKDGTHDRVFNGMLAGAVAVTDSSIYMKENFTDNELVMFELEDIDKLPHIINDLVTDKYKMQKIADEGRKKALQFHSWEKRADELYYDLISQL